MGIIREFKEFAVKGNVIDMAVGLVIGAAFGKIVTSLVNDIVMPPIGLLLGKVDFSSLTITLQEKPAVVIRVRRVHQYAARFRHCGLRDLPGDQTDQPPEEAGGCRPDHQGLSLLLHAGADQGRPLWPLHVGPGGFVAFRVSQRRRRLCFGITRGDVMLKHNLRAGS